MLFHSSLRKELSKSFSATLIVLVTIVMTMTLIRTLGLANRGTVNPEEVLMVMGYTALGYLPPILTLCLFISIVSTLSRMYSDSEMVIWFSAGQGLRALLRPLLSFAWPVLVVIATLAIVVWPWSNRQTQDLRDRYVRRGDLDRVAPGQFQESASGRRVFFLDRETPDNKSGRNVFIASTERGKETLTSARSGQITEEGDSRFLLLSGGQRVETDLQTQDIKVSDFEEYGSRVGNADAGIRNDTPAKTRPTLLLLTERTRSNQAELAWRVGLALAALNFVLLAVCASSVSPRAGRGANLALAVFGFIVYYNLINIGQNWIAAGVVPFWQFMVGLHGMTLGFALLWLIKQHNGWQWSDLFAWRRATAA